MERYFSPKQNIPSKKARVEFEDHDVVGDPALRRPIDSYAIEIKDEVRRRYLTKGPAQPIGHKFPPKMYGTTARYFVESWFQKYKWLEYSVSTDSAFCFWCYLFGKGMYSDVFVKKGFSNWKNATAKFQIHIGGVTSAHNDARIKLLLFNNQKQSVSHLMSSNKLSTEAAYRIRLTAVVDVVRFILQQGIAFRGHDECELSIRKGNFLGLIDWYSEHNEEVHNVVKSNAPGNNQTTCPEIQKQIVSACAAETTEAILHDMGDSFFSLLIDEARDCSVKEQMAIVLRFVNKLGEVVERFVGVVEVPDTSAICLKQAIDDFFAKKGLSLSRLRGQGYDGAANMRGELSGLKTLILNENPHAKYIHCFAHRLQLVVVAVAGEHCDVSNFFDYVAMIVNLVGSSCKRKDALRQKQHDQLLTQLEKNEIPTGKGKNQEISLVRPGDTRWGTHYRTLIRLLSLWRPILEVLEHIYVDGTDQKTRATAFSLLDKMEEYKFIFIAHLMRDLLGITNELSQLLQLKDQNIGAAINMVQTVKARLQALRHNGWDEFLKEVNQFCEKHDVPVHNMEDNMVGRGRRKLQNVTYLHHFRAEIFYQVIDIISGELKNRFTDSTSELLTFIACLDPRNSFASFDLQKLLHMAEMYSEDFSLCEQMELKQQLQNYIHEIRRNNDFSNLHHIGDLAKKMVEKKYHTVFPFVYKLLQLALVLPVATATVERAFSAMNIIKTDLRNKMGADFLTDSLVCYIELEIFRGIDNETILQRFQRMKTRRIQLPSIQQTTRKN